MKQLFIILFLLNALTTSAKLLSGDEAIDSMKMLSNLNVDDAIRYGDSVLQLKIENKAGINAQIGWYKIKKHEFQSAISYFLKAESDQKKSKQFKELAITYI